MIIVLTGNKPEVKVMALLNFEDDFVLHDTNLDVNEIVINTSEFIFNEPVEIHNPLPSFEDTLTIEEAIKGEPIAKEPQVGRHIAKKNSGQHPRRYCQNTTPAVTVNCRKQENGLQKPRKSEVNAQSVHVKNKQQSAENGMELVGKVELKYNTLHTQVKNQEKRRQGKSCRYLNKDSVKLSVNVKQRNCIRTKNKTKVKTKNIANSETKATKFICNVCTKSFPFRSQVIRHLSSHTGIRKYQCERCNKQFMNNYNLIVHSRKHTGDFPLKCSVCGSGFSNPSVLERHMVSHTRETKYECSLCSKHFGHVSSLRLHEKMHTKRPSFTCNVCYKLFSYSSSLQSHLKLHLGVKPYVCRVCQKAFSRNTTLARHMRSHAGCKNVKARKKKGQCKIAV